MLSWWKQRREAARDEIRVARSIAEAFRTQPVMTELPVPECTVSVKWRGHTVRAEWFASGTPFLLSIGLDRLLPEGRGSNIIFSAAKARARLLARERLADLAEQEAE